MCGSCAYIHPSEHSVHKDKPHPLTMKAPRRCYIMNPAAEAPCGQAACRRLLRGHVQACVLDESGSCLANSQGAICEGPQRGLPPGRLRQPLARPLCPGSKPGFHTAGSGPSGLWGKLGKERLCTEEAQIPNPALDSTLQNTLRSSKNRKRSLSLYTICKQLYRSLYLYMYTYIPIYICVHSIVHIYNIPIRK